MRTRFTAFMAGAIAAVSVATSVTAQTPLGPADVIRGRVSNDSGRAIVATVIVTRGPDRLVQQTTSDSSGNYRVRFEQGTGDYLVYVSASGYRAARRRVQRQHDERELVANFVLAVDVTQLAAVKTTANRPARANDPVGPMQPETGSSERWADGVSGQVSPLIAGDIASTASTMSNVTISGGGVSILGSDPSSTQTTLNGMATGATTMPRAARTDVRVTGATYDATRGGFSGANIDVRLAPGNRDYQERNAYFTINPTAWQLTDPTSRALGATTSTMRGSAAADGELIRDALTWRGAK